MERHAAVAEVGLVMGKEDAVRFPKPPFSCGMCRKESSTLPSAEGWKKGRPGKHWYCPECIETLPDAYAQS